MNPARNAESTTLPPRRRIRFRRLLLLLMFLLPTLCLFGGHYLWGWYAERQLQSRIEALQAAGEPILPRDFTVLSDNDPDNAAYVLRAAAAILNDGSKEGDWIDALPVDLTVQPKALPYGRGAVN